MLTNYDEFFIKFSKIVEDEGKRRSGYFTLKIIVLILCDLFEIM